MKIFHRKEKFFFDLTQIIFEVSFVYFLVLFLADCLVPGFVTNWFNPIWFLIISLICVIIVIAKD